MLNKRVEVLFDPEEYRAIEEIARGRRQSVGALIRKAVEERFLTGSLERRRTAGKRILQGRDNITWEEAKKSLERDVGRRF